MNKAFLTLLGIIAGLTTSLQAKPITIGPGPSIGFTSGTEFFEEFQDWDYDDCAALDAHGDSVNLGGGENARDLIALYAYDDPAAESTYFRVDLHDLFINAEEGNLDLYLLIDTGQGGGANAWPDGVQGSTGLEWELAVAVYAVPFWNIYDSSFTSLSDSTNNSGLFRGSYFRSDLDAIEFGIDRQLLLDRGWDGSSPLNLQVGTTMDFNTTLTDTLPDNSSASSDANCPTAKYAFVLHGNQAISNSNYIQSLIYNDEVQTPNGNPTGYRRALESARIFDLPPTIHVSATLVSSSLWATNEGEPDDGPSFIQEIADFLDGDGANGEGSIVWGVYSEHIMPFFEGAVNQDSIALNEDYLQTVFNIDPPNANSTFWIPERVARGTTFNDLVDSNYGWTILDQINHLREWFGNEEAEGYKIHRINGVNAFMINDEPDRFKFANTDGGLWIDTRTHLIEKALEADQEQITVVFDDWEAYAGRSFLSFNQGSDNPDNFNTNLRWLANKPWIQVLDLEEVASFGWTPVDQGNDQNLPFETYDFLDFATENSYENWYQGSGLEEDFDGFFPFIRLDQNTRTLKPFGALETYIPTNGANVVKGDGTIAEDVFDETYPTGQVPVNLTENRLGRLNYSTAIFETAWHDEDNAIRCPDGTYCNPDTTFNNIAGFARQLQFLNLRRGGMFAFAENWAASGANGSTVAESRDVDHDDEMEYLIYNNHVLLIFENDGGRLIVAFTKDSNNNPVSMIGNLLGFPDQDDEFEFNTPEGNRRSGFVDWFAEGDPSTNYINDIYTPIVVTNGFRFISSNGSIEKTITLDPGSSVVTANYELSNGVTRVYVRHGLSPDLNNILETGQSALVESDDGEIYELANTATDQSIKLNYAGGLNNTNYNAAADDGTDNSPRNMAMIHMVELFGDGDFQFQLNFGEEFIVPDPYGDMFFIY